MALVTIPNTFVSGTKAEAAKVNANFSAVAAGVNSIDNANVNSAAAIQESKILFDNAGHGHSGGTDGKLVAVPASDTLYGMVKMVSGVTAAVAPGDHVDIDWTATGFTGIPMVQVYIAAVANKYNLYYPEDVWVTLDDENGCVITNLSGATAYIYKWIAIGI